VATGRRPSTSRAELERVALDLFTSRGFEETTVDDVAAAAGIGRRTFFRYYASKNDAVWGDFDAQLEKLRQWFDQCTPRCSPSTGCPRPRSPGTGGGWR
jgi:TetR/AcrR family transcriptional regulator, regulator of mycofactocin system